MTSSLGALGSLVGALGEQKMAVTRKRWSHEATRVLIREVRRSTHMPQLMASTTAPNVGAWRGVLHAMGAEGRGRTVQQLRSKWKAVKASFHLEWAHRVSTGHPSRKTPIGYRKLLRMWAAAGRPEFRDRHYTVAMMRAAGAPAAMPQPPSRRRHCQRARPLGPLEEEEEDQPSPSGTTKGEEEPLPPPASPGTATEGALQSPGAGSQLPPSPVQGVAGEEEVNLLPPATFSQEEEKVTCHPWVHQPLPLDKVVGEPGSAGLALQGCCQVATCTGQERVQLLLHVIEQQQRVMEKQQALIMEQHDGGSRLQQLLKDLMLKG